MTPVVSVVIPTYNRKALLLEAIASVQQQTFGDLEILVCDDGSTDGSDEAVRALASRDARLRWLPGPHTGLPGAVRNRGMRAARGEWIAFQDSDDLWVPDKLEKQIAVVARQPEVQFIYSHAAALLPDGTRRRMTPFRVPRSGRIFETLLFYSIIATPTVLMRRGLGLFDEEMRLTFAEDYELFLRLSAQVPIHFVDEDLVLCRQQGDNISRDALAGLDQVERVVQATVRRLGVPSSLAARALAKIEVRRYKQHLLQGHSRDVLLEDLARALRKSPDYGLAKSLRLAEQLRLTALIRAMARRSEAYAG